MPKCHEVSGLVMLICLEGDNAIAKNRELVGATEPAHTTRKLHAERKGANTVHQGGRKVDNSRFVADASD